MRDLERAATPTVQADVASRWQSERCVGQNGAVPRLNFPSMCMQDSPVGVRDSE